MMIPLFPDNKRASVSKIVELRSLIKLLHEPRLVKRYNSAGSPLGIAVGGRLYDEVEVSCSRDRCRGRICVRAPRFLPGRSFQAGDSRRVR
jgi:hypothetical protein